MIHVLVLAFAFSRAIRFESILAMAGDDGDGDLLGCLSVGQMLGPLGSAF